MRRICYSVAMSLDGYIAGPNGEADWIVMDPDLAPAFKELYSRFDTFLIGRKTYQAMAGHGGGGGGGFSGFSTYVFSRTLTSVPKGVTLVSDDAKDVLTRLKAAPGRDIWLFGGGELFRSLLDLGLVDAIGVGVIPVLLGGGTPFLPPRASRATLRLTEHKVYPKTGTISLEYAVEPAQARRKSRAR